MHGRISQLFLINVLTCGLEVCLAAGTIYIPPLLLEAGVEERFMTMVLGKLFFFTGQWCGQVIKDLV